MRLSLKNLTCSAVAALTVGSEFSGVSKTELFLPWPAWLQGRSVGPHTKGPRV